MVDRDKPLRQRENRSVSARTRSTRRKFIAGAGVASLGVLAGCSGGGGGDGGDGNGDGGSTDGGGGNTADSVSVAAVGGGEGTLFKNLCKEYVEDDTGVTVNVSQFPYANLFEKTSSVLESKSDAYDILFMDDPWFPQFAYYVDPLEQWMPESLPRDQIIKNCIDVATWPAPEGPTVPSAQGMDEKVRGQVVVGNSQLYAYNKKFYEQVGASTPPKTWDDVLSAGKKIDQQIDGTSGYIIRGKRGNPINANFFGLGNSMAGDMFTNEWRYRWDEQAGVDTLDFYVNDLKSISPDGVASFDSDAILNGLAQGTAAQSPAWPAAASTLLDPDTSEEYDNIEFTIIPEGQRRAPQQGNWITGINSYTSDAKKRAAGKVIRSFISAEAQDKYAQMGGVPFRHDTFKNNMDAAPWFEALYESLQTCKWRPRTPLWNQVAVTQGKYLNTALTGEMSPSKALTNINKEVENLMKQAGYYEG